MNQTEISVNGVGYITQGRAIALAAYPQMRKANGFLFISGISSRRADNTHAGASKNPDGTFTLDIKVQTTAVIENIRDILRLAGAGLEHLVDVTIFFN